MTMRFLGPAPVAAPAVGILQRADELHVEVLQLLRGMEDFSPKMAAALRQKLEEFREITAAYAAEQGRMIDRVSAAQSQAGEAIALVKALGEKAIAAEVRAGLVPRLEEALAAARRRITWLAVVAIAVAIAGPIVGLVGNLVLRKLAG